MSMNYAVTVKKENGNEEYVALFENEHEARNYASSRGGAGDSPSAACVYTVIHAEFDIGHKIAPVKKWERV